MFVTKGYAFRRLDLWFRFATKPIRITKQVSAGYNPALRSMFRRFVWVVGLLQVVRSERLCLSST